MDNVVFQLFQSAWNVAGIFGLAIITAVIAAYWAFRIFSAKWLDNKFAERLENYKYNQQKELEALKFRINGLVDRTVKIYSKEYTHLPELWFQINSAYRSARAMEAGLFVPSLNTISPERLKLFLEGTEFTDLDKHDVIDAVDKDRAYTDTLRFNLFNKAQAEHAELFDSLSKYSIFLSEELRKSVDDFREMLWAAIMEYRVYSLYPRVPGDTVDRTARGVLLEQGEAQLRELERSIRDRLWSAERATL